MTIMKDSTGLQGYLVYFFFFKVISEELRVAAYEITCKRYTSYIFLLVI